MLLQKVICYPLDHFACRIRELHATQIMFCNIPHREIKSKYKNVDGISNSLNRPRFLYSSRPIQPYHFQANLIWCDGTFKLWLDLSFVLALFYKHMRYRRGLRWVFKLLLPKTQLEISAQSICYWCFFLSNLLLISEGSIRYWICFHTRKDPDSNGLLEVNVLQI